MKKYLQYLLHGRFLIEMYCVVLNTYSICYTAGSWLRCTVCWIPTVSVTRQVLDWDVLCGAEYLQYLLHAGSWLRCTVWCWIPTVSVTQQVLDWDVLCGAEYLQYLLHSRILIEMYCVALNTYSICYTAGSWLRCTVWRWIPTVSVTQQVLIEMYCVALNTYSICYTQVLDWDVLCGLNTYSICYTAGSWLRCTVWCWIPTVSVTRQVLDWDGTVWCWIPTVSVTQQVLDWDVLCGAEYLQYLLHGRFLIEMYCVALNTYSICYTAGSWLRCYCVALNTYSICYTAGSWLRCTVWRWIPTVSVTQQVLDWDVLCGAEYLQYLLHSRILIEMYCVALNTYSICYTAGSWLRCTVWRWIPTVSVTQQRFLIEMYCVALNNLHYLLHSRFLIEMYCVALNTYSIFYTAGSWLRCTVWRWIPTVSVTQQVLIEMYCVALNTYSICYTAGSWLRCTVWRWIPTVFNSFNTTQIRNVGTVWKTQIKKEVVCSKVTCISLQTYRFQ